MQTLISTVRHNKMYKVCLLSFINNEAYCA